MLSFLDSQLRLLILIHTVQLNQSAKDEHQRWVTPPALPHMYQKPVCTTTCLYKAKMCRFVDFNLYTMAMEMYPRTILKLANC